MQNWRDQDRLASVILVVMFLAGLLDGHNPDLLERYVLVYTIFMSGLVIFWLYLDAADFGQKRPETWVIIASLVFFPIGIWLHLMHTRGAAAGSLMTVIAVAIYILAYVCGLYLGEALG